MVTGDPREWIASWFHITKSVERNLLRGETLPVMGAGPSRVSGADMVRLIGSWQFGERSGGIIAW